MTVCSADTELPILSVAVHVTTVVPNGNTSGELFVIVEIPVTSSAVALPKATMLLSILVASIVISSGIIKVGGIVSITVTD